jgi:hypothetical protein
MTALHHVRDGKKLRKDLREAQRAERDSWFVASKKTNSHPTTTKSGFSQQPE